MQNIFQERIKRFDKNYRFFKQRHQLFASLRIISFVLWLSFAVFLINEREAIFTFCISVAYFIFFGIMVKLHNAIRFQYKLFENLVDINKGEIKRRNLDLKDFDTGEDLIEPNHAYHNDLDIFGKNSLFQLLNHTTTSFGRTTLGKWLTKPSPIDVIKERQDAVKELVEEIDFLQMYEATGKVSKDNFKIEQFNEWIKTEGAANRFIKLRWPLLIFSILYIACLILFNLSFSFLVPLVLLNGLILKTVFQELKDSTSQSEHGDKQFKSLYKQIILLEKTNFQSKKLKEITAVFHQNPKPSQALKQLTGLLSYLESRGNYFYVIFNILLLTDLHLLASIKKWKAKHSQDIDVWIDSLGRLEAVNSLAAYYYTSPNACFPTVSNTPEYGIAAQQLGHPLIAEKQRITNGFSFEGKGKVGLITGSNMSGKSTFLRTVGINLVLAYSGAPVCAETMSCGHFQIFTSMRTQDNLSESVSSFYAELQRIKQLLDLLSETKMPVFFVLDEILKGTNSHDRHNGALALMNQLQKLNCFGFISTHDLELSNATQQDALVENYSFNSNVIEGKLVFDYTLDEGSCKSFNASHLMKMMGIKIDD